MEIKAYLRILQKRWWIVLSLFAMTLAATTYFTLNTKPVYQAKTTYIVRLSDFATEEKNIIGALNTLTGRTEIAATYAGVASSSLIKNMAADQLGISHHNDLVVESQMRGGTNMLEITVEGTNPLLVRDYTNAIGLQTVDYVENLYETYQLELLDEAVMPTSPIRPKIQQNLILGGILGLILGIGLVLFVEYLKSPITNDAILSILDKQIGIYDMRYFRERLHQELSRARRHNGVLSVALVNIDHRRLLGNVSQRVRLDAMCNVVEAVGRCLRDEDVIASVSDTELALILPEMKGQNAKTAIERILAIVSRVPIEIGAGGQIIKLNGAAGVAPFYNGDPATTDVLLTRARDVLESMRESTYGRVIVSTVGSVGRIPEIEKIQGEEVRGTVIAQNQPESLEQSEMFSAHALVEETDDDEKVETKEAKGAMSLLKQPEIADYKDMTSIQELVDELHEGEKIQNEQASEVIAIQENSEISEQEKVLPAQELVDEAHENEEAKEVVSIQEQIGMTAPSELVRQNHSNNNHHKRSRGHKRSRNENIQNQPGDAGPENL